MVKKKADEAALAAPPSSTHPSCAACGLWKQCSTPFMQGTLPEKKTKCPIMIIGEYPTVEDDEQGEQMTSDTARYAWAQMKLAGLPIHRMYTQNAVRCCPGYGLDSADPVRHCKVHLHAEIESVQPRAILLFGNRALSSVLGKSGITKARSTVFQYALKSTGRTVPVVATFSPAYVKRNLDQQDRFVADLKFFNEVISKVSSGLAAAKFITDTAEIPKALILNPAKVELNALCRTWIKSSATVSVDTETNSLTPYALDDAFLCMVVAVSDGETTVVMEMDQCNQGPEAKRTVVDACYLHFIKDVCESSEIAKVGHNIKYDAHVLDARFGIQMNGMIDDTIALHAFLNPIQGGHDLDTVTSELQGIPKYKQAVLGEYAKKMDAKRFTEIPFKEFGTYCGCDAYWTRSNYDKLTAQLRKKKQYAVKSGYVAMRNPLHAYEAVVRPGLYALLHLEQNGIVVDLPRVDALSAQLQEEAAQHRDDLLGMKVVKKYQHRKVMAALKEQSDKRKVNKRTRPLTRERISAINAKSLFNPGSDQQVSEVLYGERNFGLEPKDGQVSLKSGRASVSADWIDALLGERIGVDHKAEGLAEHVERAAKKDDVVRFCYLVKKYQSCVKLRSTFVEGLRERVSKKTGRVYPTFNMHKAKTGRLSSSDPNLQNIPVDEVNGSRFRNQYTVDDGDVIIEADYSQIELRIQAAYSQDPTLIDVYMNDGDIHQETGEARFGKGKVLTKEQRRQAKSTNFGVIYLESAYGLAHQQNISVEDAQAWIDAFYGKYPLVREWQDEVQAFAMQYGKVHTMFGRWRTVANAMIRGDGPEDHKLRSAALREAVNAPIQGTASDCTLVSLSSIDNIFRDAPGKFMKYVRSRLLSTVHDSIIGSCRNTPDAIKWTVDVIRKTMEERPLLFIREGLMVPYNGKRVALPLKVDVSVGKRWGDVKPYVEGAAI